MTWDALALAVLGAVAALQLWTAGQVASLRERIGALQSLSNCQALRESCKKDAKKP